MTITQLFLAAAKKRMNALGWTDARMCREAGISKGAWSQYRSGTRVNLTAETMQRVIDALSLRMEITEP
jgi:transcriptional regulator with XRE-family HTH domain